MKKWILIFILMEGLSFTLSSSGKTFQEKYQEVLKNAEKTNEFSADFTQDFYSTLRNKVTKSKGSLKVQKPASFRYEVTSPHSELYVTDGVDFWKYTPDLNHAQHLLANTAELSFLRILTNFSQLKKFYTLSQWTKEDGEDILVEDEAQSHSARESDLVSFYTPPSQKNGFIYVKLAPKGDKLQKVLYAVIDVETSLIQELRIVQLNGNRTRLMFTDYSLDPVLSDVFKFSPPDGTAVNGL